MSDRPNVVYHLVLISAEAAPNPELEGVGLELRGGGSVRPAKVRAGTQQFACHGETKADMRVHAGMLWEGALHQGTDDPQFVNCPFCKDTTEYQDGIREHERHTSKDQGLFGRAQLSQRAGRFVRPPEPVGGRAEAVPVVADRPDEPLRGAGPAAQGAGGGAAEHDGHL